MDVHKSNRTLALASRRCFAPMNTFGGEVEALRLLDFIWLGNDNEAWRSPYHPHHMSGGNGRGIVLLKNQ